MLKKKYSLFIYLQISFNVGWYAWSYWANNDRHLGAFNY